jgi:hypothetical protein
MGQEYCPLPVLSASELTMPADQAASLSRARHQCSSTATASPRQYRPLQRQVPPRGDVLRQARLVAFSLLVHGGESRAVVRRWRRRSEGRARRSLQRVCLVYRYQRRCTTAAAPPSSCLHLRDRHFSNTPLNRIAVTNHDPSFYK